MDTNENQAPITTKLDSERVTMPLETTLRTAPPRVESKELRESRLFTDFLLSQEEQSNAAEKLEESIFDDSNEKDSYYRFVSKLEEKNIDTGFAFEKFLNFKYQNELRENDTIETQVQNRIDSALQSFMNWEYEIKGIENTTTIWNASSLLDVKSLFELGDNLGLQRMAEELKQREIALKASVAELGPHVVEAVFKNQEEALVWQEVGEDSPRRVWALNLPLERVEVKLRTDQNYREELLGEDGFNIKIEQEKAENTEYIMHKIRERIRGEAYIICEELGNILRTSNSSQHVTAISAAENEKLLHRLYQFTNETLNKLGVVELDGGLKEAYRDLRLVVAPYENQPTVFMNFRFDTRKKPVTGGLAADHKGVLNLVNNALKLNLAYSEDSQIVKEHFVYLSRTKQEDSSEVVVPGKNTKFHTVRPTTILLSKGAPRTVIKIPTELETKKLYKQKNLMQLSVKQMRQLQMINIRFVDPTERERLLLNSMKNESTEITEQKLREVHVQKVETSDKDTTFIEADISGFSQLSEELSRLRLPTSRKIQPLIVEVNRIYNLLGISSDRFGGDALSGIVTQKNVFNRPDLESTISSNKNEVLQNLTPLEKTVIAQIAIAKTIEKELLYLTKLTQIKEGESDTEFIEYTEYLQREITDINKYNWLMGKYAKAIKDVQSKSQGKRREQPAYSKLETAAFLTILHGMRLQGKEFGVRTYGTHTGNLTIDLQRVQGYREGSINKTAIVEIPNLEGAEEKLNGLADIATGSQAVLDRATINRLKSRNISRANGSWADYYEVDTRDSTGNTYLLNVQKALQDSQVREILSMLTVEIVDETTDFGI